VLTALRDALSVTLVTLGDDWLRRFLATRGLAARSPAVRDHSDLASLTVQRRLIELLEAKLGIDGREDLRLRLLGELTLCAWRCGARNWIRGGENARSPSEVRTRGRVLDLVGEVDRAFDAIPATLSLSA
jgi:hypothetical protein